MDANEKKELTELVEFLKANGIVKFETERDGRKVALEFASGGGIDTAHLATLLAAQPRGGGGSAPVQAATPAAAPAAEADPHAGAHIVKSPIVGTFYASPSPDAEPFVKVGDRVEVGKVLCIVEAMKLMNEIESDAAGEVVKVFPKTGQPVEYGQALFAIKQ
jgi:acetyl-CoA carboxylase biotin carboxyl carrier protein